MTPISPRSICLIWPRRLAAAGNLRRISATAAPSAATTVPPSRTAFTVPMSSPHSVRSTTATSFGYARAVICDSSIHTKSAP